MKHLLIIFIIALFPAQSYAFKAYVHSINAAVYKSPSMKSKKIATLEKGEKIKVKKSKGAWYKIESTSDGVKTGWIYKFMVRKKPITNSSKLYSKLRSFFYKIESISKKSRRRPSSYTSTAAARGLREKRQHFAEKYNSDYKALEVIESIVVTDKEAMEFLKKRGKI